MTSSLLDIEGLSLNIGGHPILKGVDLSIATLERLAAIEAVVGIKESTGTVQRSSEILKKFGDRFTVLSGDVHHAYLAELAKEDKERRTT